MAQPEHKRGPARIQLLLVAALFLGPLLFATWMYYGGAGLRPVGRSNHGILLEPIRRLADTHPELAELAAGQWLLIYVNEDVCGEVCRAALYTLRQSRLMLGNDMNRLGRVFLHGETSPDRVFLDEQHDGLKTLQIRSLAADLRSASSQIMPLGGFFLIDPHGNLVMYFGPDISPRDMVNDIKHLLKLSQIG